MSLLRHLLATGYHVSYELANFARHFLFAASLIVLGNEFAGLHPNPDYRNQVAKILTVIEYCAKTDPQADRLLYILTTFNDVVIRRQQHLAEPGPYPPSPEETQSTSRSLSNATGRHQSDAAFSDVSQQRTSITSTGSTVHPVNTGVGPAYPGMAPMAHEPSFQPSALNGTSPMSSNSYSQPTAEGTSGRRTSDVHTPAGEDEVYLEQLWRGPHCDASAGVPLFQSLADVPAGEERPDMGSFGVYSRFIHGTDTAGEAGAGTSGIPLFLQSLLNPS